MCFKHFSVKIIFNLDIAERRQADPISDAMLFLKYYTQCAVTFCHFFCIYITYNVPRAHNQIAQSVSVSCHVGGDVNNT